jgi:DNA-binding MarR family transcriptional regulator
MKNIKTTQKQSLDEVLIMFRHAMTASLLEEAKDSKCSLSHFEILMYIAEKGKVTMKDIASWLHITPPSASTLIDILVSKKFVTRTQSEKDRRTVYITLDKEAHKIFYSIHKKKMSMFKKTLSKLNEEDKEQLARILIKCIPN